MELVKEELVKRGGVKVSEMGWRTLFASYDEDGGGTLNFKEFEQAVRVDMRIPSRDIVLLKDHAMQEEETRKKLATAKAVAPGAGTLIYHLLNTHHRRGETRFDGSSIRNDEFCIRDDGSSIRNDECLYQVDGCVAVERCRGGQRAQTAL